MSDNDVNESYRISDQLWEQIEPLLPPELPKPKSGRGRMDNRKAMEAIFYVFRTGCKWKELPRSFGAPSTVHDRFQEWRKAGLFQRMWQAGLITYDELRAFIWHGRKKLTLFFARLQLIRQLVSVSSCSKQLWELLPLLSQSHLPHRNSVVPRPSLPAAPSAHLPRSTLDSSSPPKECDLRDAVPE